MEKNQKKEDLLVDLFQEYHNYKNFVFLKIKETLSVFRNYRIRDIGGYHFPNIICLIRMDGENISNSFYGYSIVMNTGRSFERCVGEVIINSSDALDGISFKTENLDEIPFALKHFGCSFVSFEFIKNPTIIKPENIHHTVNFFNTYRLHAGK